MKVSNKYCKWDQQKSILGSKNMQNHAKKLKKKFSPFHFAKPAVYQKQRHKIS